MTLRLSDLDRWVTLDVVHSLLEDVADDMMRHVKDNVEYYLKSGTKDITGFEAGVKEDFDEYFRGFWETLLGDSEDD